MGFATLYLISLYPHEHFMHVPVPLSLGRSALDICYLSVIYTLCTIRFFSLIPQPYPIQHSVIVHLRQDQFARAFHAVIDWCGLLSYEQSYIFFHCLPQGNNWVGFDSWPFFFFFFCFFFFFLSFFLHLLFGLKAFCGSDGLFSRRYVSGMELLRLVWLFSYIACISSHTRLLTFLFDALTICRLIFVDLAALYHFHTQCKGCISWLTFGVLDSTIFGVCLL